MMTEINENMSFEEMLDASFKRLRAGETTKGIVTSVTPTEVHLDLGVKYTGIIPHSEMTMDSSVKLEDIVKVGDEIEAIVIKPNDAEGTISLSKVKIDSVKCFDEIEAAEAADEILTGKVVEITRGGIAVLANPHRCKNEKLVDELVAAGLDGIEVYSPELNDEEKAYFIKYAKKNKILTTGGSNFKGLYNKHILSVGDCDLPDECIQEMNTYKARKKKLERKKAQESK